MVHVLLEEEKEFSLEKRIRKKLLGSEKLVAELICYEPGQAAPIHSHPRQDEVFYVVEGKGTIIINDEDIPVAPSSLIFVPAKEPHGI